MITRLADVLVIQAIRAWIDTDSHARTGGLGALRDPRIGRALALIHADPARAWTIASFAREVAMSGSAFAARFTELVGEPAMQYITRLRMQVAVDALRDDGSTVAELASRLGYHRQRPCWSGWLSVLVKRRSASPPRSSGRTARGRSGASKSAL